METKKGDGCATIGSILNRVMKECRISTDEDLIRVWEFWDRSVGEIIAGNAQPAAFKGSILLVHVTSSPWIHQLQFHKKDMIKKLNNALGKPLIEEIKFKIGPVGFAVDGSQRSVDGSQRTEVRGQKTED
jgi:predicted nucleic acid-binding Zn ribbon protein